LEEAWKFYSDAEKEYFEWLIEVEKNIFVALRLAAASDDAFLAGLDAKLKSKDDLVVNKMLGRIPDKHFSHLSKKARDDFIKHGKNAYRGDYVIGRARRRFEDDHWWKELCQISAIGLPDRAKYYLRECLKCYLVCAFDASVVMAGRATEFALKENLRRRGVSFDQRDTLHDIADKFKRSLGIGQISRETEMMNKIEDLVRIYRNTTAHDNPEKATKNEAEMLYASAKVVCDSLMR
jgi:HEPN domain-containing protein